MSVLIFKTELSEHPVLFRKSFVFVVQSVMAFSAHSHCKTISFSIVTVFVTEQNVMCFIRRSSALYAVFTFVDSFVYTFHL